MIFIRWAAKRYAETFNITYAILIAAFLAYQAISTYMRYGTLLGHIQVILLPLIVVLIIWSGSALKERVNVLLVVFVVGLLGILLLQYLVACRGEYFISLPLQVFFGLDK